MICGDLFSETARHERACRAGLAGSLRLMETDWGVFTPATISKEALAGGRFRPYAHRHSRSHTGHHLNEQTPALVQEAGMTSPFVPQGPRDALRTPELQFLSVPLEIEDQRE
jgi:hypothetical protein